MSEQNSSSIEPRPWIEAFAPATVSNVGPGFDCLGFPLGGYPDGLGDRVRARKSDGAGVRLLKINGDGGRLPLDSDKNTACVAVQHLLNECGRSDVGVELELDKGLPLGSGLGSSGASACAALVAVDAALNLEAGHEKLIDAARASEGIACGAAHPDNVAPCIVGGIVLISALQPLRLLSLPVPENLWVTVYTPGCEVPTAKAREVMPKSVPLDLLVRHSARLGQLVHALHSGDLALLGEAIVDEVAEPARASLIPAFLDAKAACLEAGALACTISGAGPTTFALSDSQERAKALLDLMDEAYTHGGVPGKGKVDQVGGGARVISKALH